MFTKNDCYLSKYMNFESETSSRLDITEYLGKYSAATFGNNFLKTYSILIKSTHQ